MIGLTNVRLGIPPFGAPLEFVPLHSFVMYDDLACVETFGREHRYTGPGVETYTHCSTTSGRQRLQATTHADCSSALSEI